MLRNYDGVQAFWIKPLGDVSLLEGTGRFFPSINFLSKMSPPQHNLHLGYWVSTERVCMQRVFELPRIADNHVLH